MAEQQTQKMQELIKTYRLRHGVNQTALASLVGVKQQTVSAWESGTTEPTSANLRRIATELNLTDHEWRELLVSTDNSSEPSKTEDVMRQRMDSIESELADLRSVVERLVRGLGE